MDSPLISVIVPTCGRIALLARCLDALSAQSLPYARFEVIVVDDRVSPSDDSVAAACRRARRRGLQVRCLQNAGVHGPAAARNLGWQAARSAWVGFTDDDTIPQPDWLAQACAAFMPAGPTAPDAPDAKVDAKVDALWGSVQVPLPPSPTDYELDASRLQDAGFVTANCFCRRERLAQLGGFDERFRVAWREDTDLYFRLCDAGARIVFVAGMVVLHPVRPAGWSVSLSQQRKIAFDALLYKKHRRRYRQWIRRTPRWDYYLATATLLGAGGTALAGQTLASVLLLLAWLLTVVALFGRRQRGTRRTLQSLTALLLTSALIPPLAVFWRAVGAIRFRVIFV